MHFYKGQTYKSYSIAESYREGNRVKKRILWRIGKLTEQQAEQIRLICKVVGDQDQLVTRLNDIVVQESKAYLDIALVSALWDRWNLDQAFDYAVTNSELSTSLVAKILTMNRCIDPCSHYSVPAWAAKTALEDVLNRDLCGLTDDKIYYELDKIAKNQISIENHLFKVTYGNNPESYRYVNYDLTTSYFVGYKCALSAFGKGKTECHGRRQVLLGVLINDEGYPFKWDVFPGNTAEVKTLKKNINACKTRFNMNNGTVTLVFDRGIVSEDNAEIIDNATMKYISALDRNQIPSCGVSLKPFEGLSYERDTQRIPIPAGFKKFDDSLYFFDSGVIGKKRLVVGFNPVLFKEDRKTRIEKMELFTNYLKTENRRLAHAKRDRHADVTKKKIENELKRLKIHRFYTIPELTPITVTKTLKDGTTKRVASFKIKIKKNQEVIKADQLLDGVCVFVTNHIERQGRGFKVKPESIVKAYRDKTKIEDVFKNVKSFLKIRPFFVNTEAHVKAVYTICILAYFINRYLANKRKIEEQKDYLNSNELYAPFKDIDIATLEDVRTGEKVKKPTALPPRTKKLLEQLQMLHIVRD